MRPRSRNLVKQIKTSTFIQLVYLASTNSGLVQCSTEPFFSLEIVNTHILHYLNNISPPSHLWIGFSSFVKESVVPNFLSAYTIYDLLSANPAFEKSFVIPFLWPEVPSSFYKSNSVLRLDTISVSLTPAQKGKRRNLRLRRENESFHMLL